MPATFRNNLSCLWVCPDLQPALVPTDLHAAVLPSGHLPFSPVVIATGAPPARPAPPRPLDFSLGILGKTVNVHIDAGIPDPTQRSIQAKITGATALLNAAASHLTADQIRIINLLTAFRILPARRADGTPTSARTGIDVYSGVFTLLDTYVTAAGITTSFFASDIAHDSYHIWQHQHGQNNTPANAARLEHDANQFQIAVGRFVGLTPANIAYILRDTHTFYNTGRY